MRIIKLILISFLFLFGVITAISLLLPSHIHLVKYINLSGSRDSLLSVIKSKEQWPRWHPAFVQADNNSHQKHLLSNIDTRIIKQNDSLLVMMVQQKGGKALENGWQWHASATDSSTLEWYMDFHLRWYPWEKFGSLFYEQTYGQMMENGLHNLKKEIQAK